MYVYIHAYIYQMANYPDYDRPKHLLPMVDDAWRKLPSHLKKAKKVAA
jgi:hypothetical protein